jgi:streptogrisin C
VSEIDGEHFGNTLASTSRPVELFGDWGSAVHKGGTVKVLRSRAPGLVRGFAVGLAVSALVVAGGTPAGAQGLGVDRDRSVEAVPGDRTLTHEVASGRIDTSAGQAAVMAALERDLGLTRAEVTELLADAAAAVELDARLQDRLGAAFGGSWFDHDTGALTVAVTDGGAARLARAAGAETRLVAHSERELTAITDELGALVEADPAALAGAVSWAIDVASNQVLVTVREGATATVGSVVERYGDAVRIEETSLVPQLAQQLPFLDGGIAHDNISQGTGCSTGFNLRNPTTGVGYVLTAGHCGDVNNQTVHGANAIGPYVASFFPTFDDALIRVDNPFWIQGPWVWTYPGPGVIGFVTVNGFTDAPVGTPVCKSGRTTGWTCGFITVKDEDVTLGTGETIFGMTRHNACVEPGDSGGSTVNVSGGFFAEGVTSAAVLSGGQCLGRFGQESISWYYPIVDSLPFYNAAFGVDLLVG